MNEKLVTEVHRKQKRGSGILKGAMIAFAVFFLFMGILFTTGYMLFCFLMAALYFVYDAMSARDYEYIYDNSTLEIDVIHGKRTRKTAHVIDMNQVEIVAPHDAQEVERYRLKGGTEHLKKFDYTSYDDAVPYFTMITMENRQKIKILLDLDEKMLARMKREYPDRVVR